MLEADHRYLRYALMVADARATMAIGRLARCWSAIAAEF